MHAVELERCNTSECLVIYRSFVHALLSVVIDFVFSFYFRLQVNLLGKLLGSCDSSCAAGVAAAKRPSRLERLPVIVLCYAE